MIQRGIRQELKIKQHHKTHADNWFKIKMISALGEGQTSHQWVPKGLIFVAVRMAVNSGRDIIF